MTNVAHDTLTNADLHAPGYVQSSDPGTVGAGKLWIDTSGGSGNWVLKIRNATNTAWELTANGGSGPPGSIAAYAGSSAPVGWLLCDGSAVSRSTYAALFTIVSTNYGIGDGSTTFNLPDLRGRFPLGKDNMGGTSANRVVATAADSLGGNGGEENHTLITNEMPAHTHDSQFNTSTGAGSEHPEVPGASTAFSNAGTTSSTGGGVTHNNMPPYLTLNYIIKT